ncbi:hypothetical protein [Treponema brennaborense]|uniref:Lipoprotein n=1 Tax=Treponema brennaborense (strain DSM 12168 / CIP 105900 / DD5/3) TaxID=906968 RepID=F4LIG6_TREBD|nr:hypothetical protein [Treponema brennaborense]AEE16207.1 hypothetical protein Trebr_0770 [Treponema brennaborense DSM 12168]
MNRFTLISLSVVVAAVLSFAGCASKPEAVEPEPKELTSMVKTEVVEHKGTALGITQLPIWVETYITTGILGLEKLPDYTGSYCFVGEQIGTNLNAVQTWASSFNVSREIATTVSSRVDALFTGAASGSPEGKYGTYFENVVKAAANANFSGARKINDWWVLVRRYDTDVKKKFTDEYRVYVLYTIEKDVLDQQVMSMIDKVASDSSVTDEQKSAINNVKKIMESEGF